MTTDLGKPCAGEETGDLTRSYAYTQIFCVIFALWWVTLCFFYVFPQIDLVVAKWFFVPFTCQETPNALGICGHFPLSRDDFHKGLRKLLFFLPSVIAIILACMAALELRRRRRGVKKLDFRYYGAALVSFVVGPYILVNLWLKTHSNRPRPYETDIFGGKHMFEPAGSFAGTCNNNCSFISGEGAGAGWLFCLIILVPPALRPLLVPPIVVVAFVTPALRVAWGGHYLSDAVLGWMSSPVIFFGVLALTEVTRRRKILLA